MALFIPDLICRDIYEIPMSFFTAHGVRLLLLDIDNTLVTYDDAYPTEENLRWFRQLAALKIDVVFVSNNHEARVKAFAEKTGFDYYADAAKPNPKRYLDAIRRRGLSPGACAAVGDQIFTDVAAGHLAGCLAVLVFPIKDKKSAFFRFKRACEKPFLAWYRLRKRQRSKPEEESKEQSENPSENLSEKEVSRG